jgi:hypothetical protein
MLSLAVQDNGALLLRRIAEEALDAGDRRIVEGNSFGGRDSRNSVTRPRWFAIRLFGRICLAWVSSRRTSLCDRSELICPSCSIWSGFVRDLSI